MRVHINQLPLKRNYIVLNGNFYDNLLDILLRTTGSIANAGRLTGIPKSVLSRYFRRENKRIRIDFLLKIIKFIGMPIEKVENNVLWIGNINSQGIINPKLPFTFNSRAAIRFLAAICNDGCLTTGFRKGNKFSYGRLMYNNNEKSLRKSVAKDAEFIFGSNVSKEFNKRNGYFLTFPSVVRDIVELITEFKGKKSENNPSVPCFIMENKDLILGWIEQTIADEGHVKYYPNKYRREIVWRRSFNKDLEHYKLNINEMKMLNKIGVKYDSKEIGTYKTKTGVEKIRLQIRLSKRKNLLKLSKLISIPDKNKQKIFEAMINSYLP